MILRIRHPNEPPHDVDLGEGRAGHPRLAGHLVVGGVSPADAQRAWTRIYMQRRRDEARAAEHELPSDLTGRPRLPAVPFVFVGRGHAYATDEERLAARRESWRQTARRKAERKTA